MLNTNDADQPAISADENKKQEQSMLEPLPWEVGKGFLWGLPRTAWLVLVHPSRAFRAPCVAGLFRIWLFAVFFRLIVYITSFSINCVRYYFKGKQYSFLEIIFAIPDAISSLLQIAFLDGVLRLSLITTITDFFALPIKALGIWSVLSLLILSFNNPDKCFRIACYVSATSFLFVFDDFTKIAGSIFRMYLIFIALKTIFHIPNWKSFLASVLGDISSRSTTQYFVDIFVQPLLEQPIFN